VAGRSEFAMVSTLVNAGLLAVVALATFLWDRRALTLRRAGELAPGEDAFLVGRQRRRRGISLLMGVVALVMAVGAWVEHPLAVGCLWLGVLALLLWIVLLALLDAWASHAFYSRLQQEHLAEQIALRRELLARYGATAPDSEH
jgi:peptidoglycan/LPS O-acetylase OafA/YrhL